MYTKLKYLTYFSLTALLFTGCSKDDNNTDAVVKLENTMWVTTMTDENPSTNPPGQFGINGVNQYYPWSECHMDDSFVFSKDRLSINDNGTACEDGLDLIFDTKNQPYSYNAETKKLTVGSGDDVAVLDVYELNKDRLKLGLTIATGTGIGCGSIIQEEIINLINNKSTNYVFNRNTIRLCCMGWIYRHRTLWIV